MKVLLIREGEIDDILIPPLITLIAAENGIRFPLNFRDDFRIRYQTGSGFGSVVSAVSRIAAALSKDPEAVRRSFHKVVVLLDGKGTLSARQQIQALIAPYPEFMIGVAVKEVEAWVLADRAHVIEWLNPNRERCADCRFWQRGYQPEQDPDPKMTLDRLVACSTESDYSRWGTGAAAEFVERFWKGTDAADWEVNVANWVGRADLNGMTAGCPNGFGAFYRDMIRFLQS